MSIKSSLKNKIIYYIAIFALSLFFLGCNTASAATLKINSNSATLAPGETTTLYVVLNSEGVSVNNAEATVSFPVDLVNVVSVSKTGSIFSLWVEEPYVSNTTGVITFNGGVPTPGFNGTQGPVISVVVKAKKAGQAGFVFSNAAVRANDGLGTDVLNSKFDKILNIVEEETATVIPTEPVAPTSSGPVLQISSPSHPNQDEWYKDRDAIFQWSIPVGADAIQTTIDNTPSGVPHVSYSPAINEKTVKDLKDGVWYFKARAHKNGFWGNTNTYIVRIDTTIPQKKSVMFTYDDNAKILNIAANIQDITSGIDRYEIFINDILIKKIPANEFVNEGYNLPFNISGDNNVKLVAVDRAGNSVESSGTFKTSGMAEPQLEPIPTTISVNEQLLLRGVIKNPETELTVYIRRNNDEPIIAKTKSNSDLSFFVLTPKLKAGNYEIWAETGAGDSKISSAHIYTKVTSQLLISIGSFTVTALYFIIPTLLVLMLLLLGAYYLGHHYNRFRHKLSLRTALVKKDNSKILRILKKRLEKHLEILQQIRHDRILTKEEKEIKESIEGDLDEVDRAIEEQDSE